ncbi:hypothetical protein L905_24055 [Agrobacterium sp. TS43]|uniref:hypothetical protein n=1 Tax=Agrobacterium TaxID=357 RepID=UPI0004A079F5|nr:MULTISPECIES: hypothetical protein [Agrobacterium]KDR90953.1 hypothetical protein K538_07820 [Agrobacterium tumefaciens GW4]KVK43595.1 hypothetical protein L904_27070 [Agrobacterium sp. LY4]KVK43626.1 hypothetical protein L903_27095 [Agrobacterium sp. JL28]KVK57608.1 hypothetical protein L906_26995 [Agrobacterium sp. TS45]KVK58053.1 hypothetical protein L905_24055 [Agrobacterium sp. TS43]
MHHILATAHALFAVVFFLVIMPLLAFGGFGLMMHGVNEMSDTISTVGTMAIPAGWYVLYRALNSDLLV